jgi:hypothetical protein
MRGKWLVLSGLVLMGSIFSGCASLMIGDASLHTVSADSVKVDVEVTYNRAYDASLETVRAMGGLSVDNKEAGWVKSEKDNYNLAVHVEKLTEKTSRITVSASQDALPKPQYARDVLAKILKRVKQQPFWLR